MMSQPRMSDFSIDDEPAGNELINVLVRRIISELETRPFTKFLSTRALASIIKCSLAYIQSHCGDPLLQDFRVRVGKRMWWGSRKSIAAFKEAKQREGEDERRTVDGQSSK